MAMATSSEPSYKADSMKPRSRKSWSDISLDTDTSEVKVVAAIHKNKGVSIQGVWPGWPLAITLALFTQNASDPANLSITECVSSLLDDPNGFEASEDLEVALQEHGLVEYHYTGSRVAPTMTGEEYFELLLDQTRHLMREHGPLRFGPYVLRDAPFTLKEPETTYG
jgi:hypothetical protein